MKPPVEESIEYKGYTLKISGKGFYQMTAISPDKKMEYEWLGRNKRKTLRQMRKYIRELCSLKK